MTRRESAVRAIVLIAGVLGGSNVEAKSDYNPWLQIEIPESEPYMGTCADKNKIGVRLGIPCAEEAKPYGCAIEVRYRGKVARISADELMQSLGAVEE